jgi:hypothetical protein
MSRVDAPPWGWYAWTVPARRVRAQANRRMCRCHSGAVRRSHSPGARTRSPGKLAGQRCSRLSTTACEGRRGRPSYSREHDILHRQERRWRSADTAAGRRSGRIVARSPARHCTAIRGPHRRRRRRRLRRVLRLPRPRRGHRIRFRHRDRHLHLRGRLQRRLHPGPRYHGHRRVHRDRLRFRCYLRPRCALPLHCAPRARLGLRPPSDLLRRPGHRLRRLQIVRRSMCPLRSRSRCPRPRRSPCVHPLRRFHRLRSPHHCQSPRRTQARPPHSQNGPQRPSHPARPPDLHCRISPRPRSPHSSHSRGHRSPIRGGRRTRRRRRLCLPRRDPHR